MGIKTAVVALGCMAMAIAGCSKEQDKGSSKTEGEPQTKPAPAPEAKKTRADMMARANELAQKFTIVDGHIDLPYRLVGGKDAEGNITEDVSVRTDKGDFDYVRAKAGGLDAPFMSIYVPAKHQKDGGAKKLADELIDLVASLAKDHPDKFALATSPEDVRTIKAAGKVALPMGIENGAAIEGDLANLAYFRERGVRYMTLTHAKDNRICDSSYDESRTHKGLSEFGKKVVPEMNRVGIMIDISHVSDDTFWQVLELTKVPVIASHSSLRHFVPGFHRNMDDKMVAAIKGNGGVIMINFGSTFVDAESNKQGVARRKAGEEYAAREGLDRTKPDDREKIMAHMQSLGPMKLADVDKVADHIERVVELAGIDHVGFGSDFDGVGPTLPNGLEDASKYPALIAELLARGWSEEDIGKLCSGNVLRVWQAAEDYAAKQKQEPAPK